MLIILTESANTIQLDLMSFLVLSGGYVHKIFKHLSDIKFLHVYGIPNVNIKLL